MKALSIKQPWAWAILYQGKNAENRKWKTNLRGKIAIHAGKTIDQDGIKFLKSLGIDVPKNLPTGGLVGEVTITDCKPVSDCKGNKWAFGPYCFVLADPYPYAELKLLKGQLGFFNVPEDKE